MEKGVVEEFEKKTAEEEEEAEEELQSGTVYSFSKSTSKTLL